jgi:LuxR family maltose regulon positive regulatory protein
VSTGHRTVLSTTNTFLLTTKIHPPRARATKVARPRLTARLEQAICHQLTLISAPAGSGKTTLLSEWLAHCSAPFAWVALDEDDNDAARFVGYCIAALRTLTPKLGETATALLQTPEPLEPVLIALINELISLQQNDFLLILDDYHLIHNQAIQRAMTFLLEHQPAHMHLIIASRVDPPLPLARLRARGELNELHLADLRFTPEEAAYFCQEVMGLHLNPEHIATLEERTEGWIAGLQLAALSLRGYQSGAEVAAFVRSFSGRDRYVLDYLLEEVLQQLPAAIQEFLLNSSILDRLSPSLCVAVHDQHEPLLLEELERANLFLVPLDNERRWYRYHHLFAELLRVQLHQRYPEREITLYQRAAAWYERNSMPEEAVSYALAARDFERAARLINDVAEGMLKRGEAATVASWLKQVPDELVRSEPVLSLAYAMMLLATSHFEQVEDYLQAAEQGLQSPRIAQRDIACSKRV